MKKIIFSWLLSILFLSAVNAQYGTERTGYEGDFFSLEGAIEAFKQSRSIRDFERKINTEDNWVNNLDLNYDGRIDYIRVEHRRQGDFHAIILQIPVNRYDLQDVAVIEIEKVGRRQAILQIVGDEDLYGEEVIVEPVEGYSNSRSGYNSNAEDYVNVYYWSAVQYILGRQYQVYVSPFRWQYYPSWWSPWRQYAWNVYRPRIVVYHRHYHVVHRHRVIRVHNFYRPYRSYCPSVVQRTNQTRIKHGRPPVHRSTVQNDRTRNGDQRTNNRTIQPSRKATPTQRTNDRVEDVRQKTPAAIRQRTTTTRPSTTRKTTTRSNTTRTPTTRPNTTRSTTTRSNTTRTQTTRPSTTRTPTTRPNTTRSTTTRSNTTRTQTTRPSTTRKTTTRPSTTRSTTTRSSSQRSSTSRNRSSAPTKKSAPRKKNNF